MSGEPQITVVGNLVADPEGRVSQGGKSWCTFRVANTPRVKDRQSGEYVDGEALWLGCRAYGELSEHIVASLGKGLRVIMQGRLTQRSYEQDGQKRTSLDLEVEAIGPELRFATAQVTRGARSQGSQQPQGSPNGGGQAQWGQPAVQAPQMSDSNAFGGDSFGSEQPF